MKVFSLTILSLFALFALSTANAPSTSDEMGTIAGITDMPVVSRRLALVPAKLFDVTVKFALFNQKMRPKFEDGTIDHPKYKKRVRTFARRAQKVMLDDLEEPDEETVSARSISAKGLNSDPSMLYATSRNPACDRCQGGCAAATFSCRRGCVFTGPEGVVECEVAWAAVAVGCYAVCATRYC